MVRIVMESKTKKNTGKRRKIIVVLISIIMISLIAFLMTAKDGNKQLSVDKIETLSVSGENNKKAEKNLQLQNYYMNNQKKFLDEGYMIFIDPKNDNELLINNSIVDDEIQQADDLDKGLITFPGFNDLSGNLVLFGHNSYYGNFLSPEVDNLKKGDEIDVLKKEGGSYFKYKYFIQDSKVVNDTEVDEVYYPSEKSIITIGTCQTWQKTNKRIVWTGIFEEKIEINL